MRYFVYTFDYETGNSAALQEVRRNDAGDPERFVAMLAESYSDAIYFEVAP